jgi:ribosomal protein L16 Arg81 hydroxylase
MTYGAQTPPPDTASSALSWLMHPVTAATFCEKHWDQQHLVIGRDNPTYYSGLLGLDDVDYMLSVGGDTDLIRAVSDGPVTTVGLTQVAQRAQLDALLGRYRNGMTIAIDHAENRHERLQQLAHQLSKEASGQVHASVYLTPPDGGSAHPVHYDLADSFVMQLHGTKHWTLFGRPYPRPLDSQPNSPVTMDSEPDEEFDLRPGDLFYMPRGILHRCRNATDVPSVHLVLGVHGKTYAEIISDGVMRESVDDDRYRAFLPFGWMDDQEARDQVAATLSYLSNELIGRLSPRRMAAEAAMRTIDAGGTPLRHYLTDQEMLAGLTLDTPVRQRTGQMHNLVMDGTQVVLYFSAKELRFPAEAQTEIQYVAGTSDAWMTSRDLPGSLSESNRLLITRTLISEGFLTMHQPGGPWSSGDA